IWTGALGGSAFSSSPAISAGVIYINSQHVLSAFAASGCGRSRCNPMWQAVDNVDFFDGSPAVAKGRVYVALESGLGVYATASCTSAAPTTCSRRTYRDGFTYSLYPERTLPPTTAAARSSTDVSLTG